MVDDVHHRAALASGRELAHQAFSRAGPRPSQATLLVAGVTLIVVGAELRDRRFPCKFDHRDEGPMIAVTAVSIAPIVVQAGGPVPGIIAEEFAARMTEARESLATTRAG